MAIAIAEGYRPSIAIAIAMAIAWLCLILEPTHVQPFRLRCAALAQKMSGADTPSDPGALGPPSEPLRVGHDRENDEYVELWFQTDQAKDPRALTLPRSRLGGWFGWGYLTRRSRGACFEANGTHKLCKVHLCPQWPCTSDHRKSDGTVDVEKWAGFPPWHLVWCQDGWPVGAGAGAGSADSAVAGAPPGASTGDTTAVTTAVKEALAASRAKSAAAEAAGEAVPFPKPAPLRPREPALAVVGPVASSEAPEAVAPSAPTPVAGVSAVRRGSDPLYKLLQLSREVRQPRRYVGYSAFLVFGMLHGIRVHVWEGANRVGITKVFLPEWAYQKLSTSVEVDAALCVGVPDDGGLPKWAPVSEEHPIGVCNHYVPVCHTGFVDIDQDTSHVDGFYGARGVAVVSTFADGDCGPHVMLHMLGARSTLLARNRVRDGIADFMVERAKLRWFQEVMAACQEITWEEVAELQRLEEAVASEMPVAPPVSAAAVAGAAVAEVAGAMVRVNDGAPSAKEVCQELLDAIVWSTNAKEESVLLVIAEALAPVERDEQIRLYRERDAERPKKRKAVVLVQPQLFKSRVQVSQAYDEHLRSIGWAPGARIPYGSMKCFLSAWDWGPWASRPNNGT